MSDDIIDRIDALVDEQLANYDNRSGYDHNINQDRCRCGRDWHGLPITKRIDRMRLAGRFDAGYTYADDTTPIMCVGSDTPGPWRHSFVHDPIWQLPDDPSDTSRWITPPCRETFHEMALRLGLLGGLPGPATVRLWNGDLTESREVERADIESFSSVPPTRIQWRPPQLPTADVRRSMERLAANVRQLGEQFEAIRDAFNAEPEPHTETLQQRALPQPSTTPPFWAHDPTRSRRPKRRRNQPTRQGIA